jgi:hypothetical protein
MIRKTKTGKIQGGAEYSYVKDRIKAFRQDNPNGDITTEPTILPDGRVMFKATAIKNKTDEASASATGHALSTKSGDKDFEKLETTAVGRALALLGYSADGEIASAEEMEEYEAWLEQQAREHDLKIDEIVIDIEATKTVDELKEYFTNLAPDFKTEEPIQRVKNKKYKELTTNETTEA